MRIKLILAAFVILSFAPGSVYKDYPEAFGNDYTWAATWVNSHASAFDAIAKNADVPAVELKAIVFPELIRYSSVYDALEVQSLKFLYTSRGKDYADFSVGYFQMKPSFAENVEKDAVLYLTDAEMNTLELKGLAAQEDNEQSRSERISRITSVNGQLKYLAAFYKICTAKFSGTSFANAADRVKFFATCYNAGYRFQAQQIREKAVRKFFHTGTILQSANYCYADISAYWLSHQ
jgi:hypothetical protein